MGMYNEWCVDHASCCNQRTAHALALVLRIFCMMLVEDKHELQDVESPVEMLSVESHSQSKEQAVEQQGSSHCTIYYSVAVENHGILNYRSTVGGG